jgi:hypothetical protein
MLLVGSVLPGPAAAVAVPLAEPAAAVVVAPGALPVAAASGALHVVLPDVAVVLEDLVERLGISAGLVLLPDVLLDGVLGAELLQPFERRKVRGALHLEVQLRGLHVGAHVVQGVQHGLAAELLLAGPVYEGLPSGLVLACVVPEPGDLAVPADGPEGVCDPEDPLAVAAAVLVEHVGILVPGGVDGHEPVQVAGLGVHQGDAAGDVGPVDQGHELGDGLLGAGLGRGHHRGDPLLLLGLQVLGDQELPEGVVRDAELGLLGYDQVGVLGVPALQPLGRVPGIPGLEEPEEEIGVRDPAGVGGKLLPGIVLALGGLDEQGVDVLPQGLHLLHGVDVPLGGF